MAVPGPDPQGAGPEPSTDLERARRRLYRPGGPGAEEVADYRSLAHEADLRAPVPPAPTWSPAPPAARPPGAGAPRSRRIRRLLVAGAVVVAGAVLAVAAATTRPALPEQVAAPALPGTTLLVHARMQDPSVRPGQVTFQPEGYTVFRTRGRLVQVALRCVGEGAVRISAGAPFDFDCTDRESVQVRTDTRVRSPAFVIMGRTVGNVVWSARIVVIEADPIAVRCRSCAAAPEG